jgi:hypothetical protein
VREYCSWVGVTFTLNTFFYVTFYFFVCSFFIRGAQFLVGEGLVDLNFPEDTILVLVLEAIVRYKRMFLLQ